MSIKKLLLAVICVFLSAMAMASNDKSHSEDKDFKTIPNHADFTNYNVTNGGSAEAMASFLKSHSANLPSKDAALILTHTSTSIAAYHYTFMQTYKGIPVYASDIRMNVSKQNVVFAIFDDSYDMSNWNVNTTAFDFRKTTTYETYVRQYFAGALQEEATSMIAYDEATSTAEFCYQVRISDPSHHQREVLVSRDRIIYEHDLNMYHVPAKDSVVKGLVFNPDPITTAHVAYGGLYTNHNDSDVAVLNAQRKEVNFAAEFDSNSRIFSLNSHYIQLQSNTAPATSMTPDFSYTRAHSQFEDVMVFYHLNIMRSYLHDMGFTMGDTPVIVDPHGTTADNSWFSQPHYLTFGTGGIPDAQDADVIIHEYTHFLSYWANKSGSSTGERGSLDEGISDYNASSYSRSIDDYNWQKVYNFDGNNPAYGWYGRVVNDFTIYPAKPTVNVSGIYQYCETWSSALMSIFTDLGRGVTDSLAFESLYSYGRSTTLKQAAQLVINADCQLFQGRHISTIASDFALHGLGTGLLNCSGHAVVLGIENNNLALDGARLAANEEKFRVIIPQAFEAFTIDLYDMTGKKLLTYQNNSTDIRPELPNGLYIIDVSAQGVHKSFKWVMVK